MSRQYSYYDTVTHGYGTSPIIDDSTSLGSAVDASGVRPASTATAGWAINSNYDVIGGVTHIWNTVNNAGGFTFHQKTGAGTDLRLYSIYGDATFSEQDFYCNNVDIGFVAATATEMSIGTIDTLPVVIFPNNNPTVYFLVNGTVGIGTATPGATLDVVGTVKTTGYTVATLPAASTALKGARAYVTDALAPTFLAAVVGGGAIITPVFCNGTTWIGG